MHEYDNEMAQQRQRGRAASKFEADISDIADLDLCTEFSGYDSLEQISTVMAIYQDGGSRKRLETGESGGIVLEATPFYAESGGQVGDQGVLTGDGILFEVRDTQKQGKTFIHIGVLKEGTITVNQTVTASVNHHSRSNAMRNHSATHLLHSALREILGNHVTQKGSLVAPDRLRFDFSHSKPVSTEQIQESEQLVNGKILENSETRIRVMPLEEAMQSDAMSLFGEKYDEMVRVLSIGGDFSTELCGGTHVRQTGDIGFFKITSETGIAAGVRRIEAVTGAGAYAWVRENEEKLTRIVQLLKADRDTVDDKLGQQLDRMRKLEKEVEQLKAKLASHAGSDIAGQATDIDGIKVIASTLDGADVKALRETVDQLKNKLGTAALILAAVTDSKVSLVAGVTKDSTDRIKAGDLVNFVAEQVGGRGGGRPDMAQAGGNDPAGLDSALASVPDWVRRQLAN
jgi:alanyl-tRNA synthetase